MLDFEAASAGALDDVLPSVTSYALHICFKSFTPWEISKQPVMTPFPYLTGGSSVWWFPVNSFTITEEKVSCVNIFSASVFSFIVVLQSSPCLDDLDMDRFLLLSLSVLSRVWVLASMSLVNFSFWIETFFFRRMCIEAVMFPCIFIWTYCFSSSSRVKINTVLAWSVLLLTNEWPEFVLLSGIDVIDEAVEPLGLLNNRTNGNSNRTSPHTGEAPTTGAETEVVLGQRRRSNGPGEIWRTLLSYPSSGRKSPQEY